jgi:hypothetical protein
MANRQHNVVRTLSCVSQVCDRLRHDHGPVYAPVLAIYAQFDKAVVKQPFHDIPVVHDVAPRFVDILGLASRGAVAEDI